MKTKDIELRKYLDEIGKVQVLNRAEELTLIPAAKSGDKKASDRVIQANLRFVVSIAKEYEGQGMPLMDVISEGNLGLIRALDTFDPSRGYKFITYAKWWIRQSIIYALIYKGHLIRVPQSQLRKMNKAKKSIAKLKDKLKSEPNNQDVMSDIGQKEEYVQTLTSFLGSQASLDAPLDKEETDRLIDLLPDREEVSPDATLQRESFKIDLENAFRILKRRESRVLTMLFGLDGQRRTLGEVGEVYGISRERVRQIKNEALDKLKESTEIKNELCAYLA